MNGSVKIFIASLIVLACSVGFFLGSLCCHNPGFCPKAPCAKMMPPPPPPQGEMPRKDFGGPDFHQKGPNPAIMDSMLQLTPEQKAAMDKNRETMEQSFKELRKQKMEAEKVLKEALDSGDETKIAEAKGKILAAQEALLNNRIEGVSSLNKILTKEQQEKFQQFQKEMFKKHGHHKGPHKGPHGDHEHHGEPPHAP